MKIIFTKAFCWGWDCRSAQSGDCWTRKCASKTETKKNLRELWIVAYNGWDCVTNCRRHQLTFLKKLSRPLSASSSSLFQLSLFCHCFLVVLNISSVKAARCESTVNKLSHTRSFTFNGFRWDAENISTSSPFEPSESGIDSDLISTIMRELRAIGMSESFTFLGKFPQDIYGLEHHARVHQADLFATLTDSRLRKFVRNDAVASRN